MGPVSGRMWARRALALTIVVVSLGLALAVYFKAFGTGAVEAVSRWTAQSSGLALGLLGNSVTVDGNVVSTERFAYQVVAECTALGPLLLYLAAVLAYPSGWRGKVWGVGLGLVAIGLINQLRMVSLFYIGAYASSHLDVAHLLVWQGLIILSVVLLWLYWMQRWAHGRYA